MRVLLDTHIFLWLQSEPERLGAHLAMVEDQGTDLLVSAASSWEIVIKHGLGRLDLPDPPDRYIPERIRRITATPLPITHAHTLAVGEPPPIHRDPVDRVLLAQAHTLGTPLLTADGTVHSYPVETLLATGS